MADGDISRPMSGFGKEKLHTISASCEILQGLLQPPKQSAAALGGSLDAYIQSIRKIPILDVSEELALARRFRLEQDTSAARTLVLSNLRFVVHIARGYRGYGLALADLVQEGNVGLLRAVKRFDPDFGGRVIAFAVHWIKAEIHEFIFKNWRIVKMVTTKAQRKLFFKLRGARNSSDWMSKAEVERIAKELNVRPKDVRQMESRFAAPDVGFNAVTTGDSVRLAPEEYLRSSESIDDELEAADWNEQHHARLSSAIATLDPRSREIVERRWLAATPQGATLQSLADKFGLSAERIRQIQQKALRTLRSAMEPVAA